MRLKPGMNSIGYRWSTTFPEGISTTWNTASVVYSHHQKPIRRNLPSHLEGTSRGSAALWALLSGSSWICNEADYPRIPGLVDHHRMRRRTWSLSCVRAIKCWEGWDEVSNLSSVSSDFVEALHGQHVVDAGIQAGLVHDGDSSVFRPINEVQLSWKIQMLQPQLCVSKSKSCQRNFCPSG